MQVHTHREGPEVPESVNTQPQEDFRTPASEPASNSSDAKGVIWVRRDATARRKRNTNPPARQDLAWALLAGYAVRCA